MSIWNIPGGRPAFILTGWEFVGGHVRILATRSVWNANLEVQREYGDITIMGDYRTQRIYTEARTTLTAEIGQLTLIEGPHWRGALEGALRKWSPDKPGDAWK